MKQHLQLSLFAALVLGCAGPSGSETAPDAEAATPAWVWKDVELMGHRTVDRDAILAEVDFRPDEPYATTYEDWKELAEHLEQTFGFADVQVSAVRFVGYEAFLVVDVVEAGDEDRLAYREAPAEERPLADERVEGLFERLSELRAQGFERGQPSPESADEGFLDFADPDLHALVLELNETVPAHRDGLIEVLAHDSDRDKRARAATLLNWGGDVEDSIARVHAFASDPDTTVRNNVTRFMLHYLHLVDSAEVRSGVIRELAVQLRRPSHADRNKATYGLLHIAEAWPQDLPRIAELAGDTLRAIARDSILSNVRGPAEDLVELIEAGGQQ